MSGGLPRTLKCAYCKKDFAMAWAKQNCETTHYIAENKIENMKEERKNGRIDK